MNLRDAIQEAGLTRHAELIERMALPSVRLVATRVPDGAGVVLGASRIGGTPDLPQDEGWAYSTDDETHRVDWNGTSISEEPVPLPFLTQINFAELAPLDVPDTPLPPSGILYVFADPVSGNWQIRYASSGATLSPTLFPADLPARHRYPKHAMTPFLETSLPLYADCGTIGSGTAEDASRPSFYDMLDPEAVPGLLTSEEAGGYSLLRGVVSASMHTDMPDRHRMLGCEDPIQNPVILDIEARISGFPYDYATLCNYNDPLTQCLIAQARASDWVLLLQIDSVSGADGMMWGDGGMNYWWIKRGDLLRLNFSGVCFNMDCF